MVSTHSRLKAAGQARTVCLLARRSFNTQPPEGGWQTLPDDVLRSSVSTHSRPKAAGRSCRNTLRRLLSFNTQPPEGGWVSVLKEVHELTGFNTQPPEGGWHQCGSGLFGWPPVSTHSRPKAAGQVLGVDGADGFMFQHTAARRRLVPIKRKR